MSMASFSEYLDAVRNGQNISFAILVELLDSTEQIAKPIFTDILDTSGSIRIVMQNGIRRVCSLVLDNSKGKYDIDINKLWIYQKLRIQTGIHYVNKQGEVCTYLEPQGIYYVTNPESVYNPSSKTIKFELADKWVRLNGRLGGNLDATYSFPKSYIDQNGVKYQYEYDMYNIIRNLLKTPLRSDIRNIAFVNKVDTSKIDQSINKFLTDNGFDLFEIKKNEAVTDNFNKTIYYCSNNPSATTPTYPSWSVLVTDNQVLDNVEPMLSRYFYNKDIFGNTLVLAPYSIKKQMGGTYEEILLEIAKILGAEIYYDKTGRLIVSPTQDSSGNLKDIDKEVAWDFTVGDGILYDIPSETYDFENVYNQVVLKGAITDVGSYTVSVQNNDISSPTSVGRIGTKVITYDDGAIYNPEVFVEKLKISKEKAVEYCEGLLRDYAKYLLKKHTIVQSRISLKTFPLAHLDVGKVISVTKDDGTKKKYLITSIDMPLNPVEPMSIEANAVFDLDNIKILA